LKSLVSSRLIESFRLSIQPVSTGNGTVDMTFMFQSANTFNQDLCDWGPRLSAGPGGVVITALMFSGTSCPSTLSPDFSVDPPGPFCSVCGPTMAPTMSAAPSETPPSAAWSVRSTSPLVAIVVASIGLLMAR